jgi:hypothetical protein
MFIDNHDGTYTVRFFNGGKADYVTVDRYLPVDASGNFVYANLGASASSDSNVLWVALAEKAYAQLNASAWLGRDGTYSYNGVTNTYDSAGNLQPGGISAGWDGVVMSQIRGQSHSSWSGWSSTSQIDQLVTDFNTHRYMIALGTPDPKDRTIESNVVPDHAYFVQQAWTTYPTPYSKVNWFKVVNPWGDADPSHPHYLVLNGTEMIKDFSYFAELNPFASTGAASSTVTIAGPLAGTAGQGSFRPGDHLAEVFDLGKWDAPAATPSMKQDHGDATTALATMPSARELGEEARAWFQAEKAMRVTLPLPWLGGVSDLPRHRESHHSPHVTDLVLRSWDLPGDLTSLARVSS